MLKGRVAVIVSGATGVGAAMARCLGGLGASVVITYSPDELPERVVSKIVESGGDALTFQSAMISSDDYKQALAFANTELGHVDLFFNNARDYPSGAVAKTEDEYLAEFLEDFHLAAA